MVQEKYDVVILGGGLAGLTLAIQIKKKLPDISLLVLEKRSGPAPVATHKVGESLVELGAFYLREVIGLREHLLEDQLPKLGLRFFFSPQHRDDISKRVEVGTRAIDPTPTHQIDRGLIENELAKRNLESGIHLILGAKVAGVDLSESGHEIQFELENNLIRTNTKWVIDSTGRNSFLKRKLGLEKEMEHHPNAAWFRVREDIDINDWSDNVKWVNDMGEGHRRLATNHLMGKGYWVWVIPLSSGHTSIGIVADPAHHKFDDFNTLERAMNWLENNEPLASKMLGKYKDLIVDFKVMKHFAHDTKQFYSSDRWGVTGEAGAFLDPFYSPGTDFISLANTWLTDLVVRDLSGEDITLRAMIYEHAHRELLNGWILLYQNMYPVFENAQIMILKIVWDWATYWAIPTLLFTNNGYTDLHVLKKYSSNTDGSGRKFALLNEKMQSFFLTWGKHVPRVVSDQHINLFDVRVLHRFQKDIILQYTPDNLIKKIDENVKIIELIACEIFRLGSAEVNGTPATMKVDPYTMKLEDGKDLLLKKSESQTAVLQDESIREDLAKMWLTSSEISSNEYAK